MDEERHLRLALATAAGFGVVGILLEVAYGLRIRGFLDDPLRREFLRLGHAHGAILALSNVALGFALVRLRVPEAKARPARTAGWLGGALIGAGFIGGGLWHARSDPGPLVLLVPAGALMYLAALLVACWPGSTHDP